MELTSKNVHNVFMDCLFDEHEPKDNPVITEGVMCKVGFNPNRLKKNEDTILGMLKQLPKEFMQSGGGGMSFLNACMDINGSQWTGEHRTIDQLLCLGIASGKAKTVFEKPMWSMFPGGMPYFVVLDKEISEPQLANP